MKKLAIAASITAIVALSGCSTIGSVAEKTNTLSDETIINKTSGVLGYSPKEVTLVSRRTEGTDTYVLLTIKDRKEFSCVINGGNLLTFGMSNPPSCARKGEPINTNPFTKK